VGRRGWFLWVFFTNVIMYSCGQKVLVCLGILYECADIQLWAEGVFLCGYFLRMLCCTAVGRRCWFVWVFCMTVMMYSCGQKVLVCVGILYECYDVELWAEGVGLCGYFI
jgi:hypothetical protein